MVFNKVLMDTQRRIKFLLLVSILLEVVKMTDSKQPLLKYLVLNYEKFMKKSNQVMFLEKIKKFYNNDIFSKNYKLLLR